MQKREWSLFSRSMGKSKKKKKTGKMSVKKPERGGEKNGGLINHMMFCHGGIMWAPWFGESLSI